MRKRYYIVNVFLVFFLTTCLVLSVSVLTCEAREKAAAPKALTPEEKKALIQELKHGLDGTKWDIVLTQIVPEGAKRKSIESTVHFEEAKVKIEMMEEKGFGLSNFTVRVKGRNNDKVIWETMQSSENSGVAFIRGELVRGSTSMRGVLSWHITDEKKKDYSFRGTARVSEPVMDEPVEEIAEESVSEEAAESKPVEAVVTQTESKGSASDHPKGSNGEAAEAKDEIKGSKKESKKKSWWQR